MGWIVCDGFVGLLTVVVFDFRVVFGLYFWVCFDCDFGNLVV